MARRRDKDKITDPFERARLKKLRSAQRREERKKRKVDAGDTDDRSSRKASTDGYSAPMVRDDYLWIRGSSAKAYAQRILNNHRERPYWLSLENEGGNPPVSNFYPCTTFYTKDRLYYGFLFREHRDLFFATLDDARKEYTDQVRSINPSMFS